MAKEEKITYKRISPNDVKVIFSSGNIRTEVLARVVGHGSYEICKAPSNSVAKGKSSAKEGTSKTEAA